MQDIARAFRTFCSTALLAASAAIVACDSSSLTQPEAQPNLASAQAQPEIQTTIEPYTQQFDCQELGFPYMLQEEGVVKTVSQLFYDNSGDPLRVLIHFQVISTIANLQTGNTYRDYAGLTVEIDFTTNTYTVNGGPAHITAPGEGIVLQEVGTIRFDVSDEPQLVFVAGPHNASILNYCLAVQ